MPTNHHAMIRYQTLDRCFRDRSKIYHWKELADACEQELYHHTGKEVTISRRTIMYDIKHMKSGSLGYEAPIEHDRKEGYFYTRSNFSIHQIPLNPIDLEELGEALTILKQLSGNEKITGIEHVLTKLEHSANVQRKRSRPIIHFEHSLNEPGQQWVNTLYQYIKARQTLMITYQPFGKSIRHIPFSPYLIKEFDNRWFLIGYSPDYQGVITLGLDRIQSIKTSIQSYHLDDAFNPDEWFQHIIGVSKFDDEKMTIIEFRAFGTQVNYLLTKPLHESQKLLQESDGDAVFSIEVIPNYEMMSKFLSLGETVEIISPLTIRTKIKEQLEATLAHYI